MKKYVRLMLCAVAAAAVVSGCSGNKKAEETTAAATTAAAQTEAATQAEKAEMPDLGKVTKLGAYKGLSLKKPDTEVTEEMVDTQIEAVLDSNVTWEEVDRPAELGDTVNIDYVGMKDGVAFQGGTAEGHDLELGSHSFIDGFEDGLVGAKKGDELSLNLTFPEQYHSEELAGQEVVFDVTVNAVKEEVVPELNDEFVKSVSECENVADYRQLIRDSLQEDRNARAKQLLEDEALQAVVDASEFECNPEAVEQAYQEQFEYYTNMVAMYGMDLEMYCSIYGMTVAGFQEEVRKSAENGVKQQLAIDAIVEAEKIEINDDDRQKVADYYSMDLQNMKDNYSDALETTAIAFRVVEFLVDNAEVK